MPGVYNFQPRGNWGNIGSLTAAKIAMGADKSDATIDILASTRTIIYEIPNFWLAFELRFKGVATDGDSNVINVYAERGEDDDFILLGTLTLTTGTQTDGTNLYVDTIVETVALKWPSTVEVMSGADNSIARIAMNTHGYRKLLFIATTLNSTSLLVDIARAG